MPTLTKIKKSVAKKPAKAPAKRRSSAPNAAYSGLVRDPVTGLLVNPLRPGQKPLSRAELNAALADAL